MFYIIPVQPGKVAFRETEVVNGIQQVGFSHPIFTADACNPFCKVKRLIRIVFELIERYVLKEKH